MSYIVEYVLLGQAGVLAKAGGVKIGGEMLLQRAFHPHIDGESLQMAKAASVPIAAALWCRQDAPEIIEYMTRRCDFAFHSTKELYDFLFSE